MSSRSQSFIARNTPPIFSFGRYTLDLIRGAFLRGADEIKLRPKSYETLKHLVLNAGRLVPKTELIEILWPEAVSVSDDSVNHCVRDVRRALGDDGQEFIRTVPGRGYMFIAPFEAVPAQSISLQEDEEPQGTAPEPAPLDAPAALQQIVKPSLAKQPGQRHQTMTEMGAALDSISVKLEEQQASIAVLPFANMSRDADDEYFTDGLAEEILNMLAHIPGLKVTARTSSFAFRGKEQDITKIAETLRVRTILEGSVRRAGSRIRVKAQLINGDDGYHIWSERYDCELADVFAMQDEIAAAIAGALQVKLTGKPATMLHEPNLPAYEAFLKARYQFLKRSLEVPARTEELYKQAIALDPQWAAPHCALGSFYFILGAMGFRPLSEMAPLARAEAWKALELLPSEPLAHALLGAIAASYDYDWREAEEHFKVARACESLPPEVHWMYADLFLAPLGRFKEALQEWAIAIAQDPVNDILHAQKAFTLLCAEMYELAMVEARKALALDDMSSLSHWVIALSHFLQGRSGEAREPAEEAFRRLPWHSGVIGFLAGLLVQAGEMERAEKLIASMRGMIPIGMIFYHLVCSEIDAGIDWYERGIEQHQPLVALYAFAGFIKPLRSSPRWPKLAKMMNLPEKA